MRFVLLLHFVSIYHSKLEKNLPDQDHLLSIFAELGRDSCKVLKLSQKVT